MIAVLSFICSCLVSYSPSEEGQFNSGCCSLAQEMISVIYSLPYFREWLIDSPTPPQSSTVFTALTVFVY
jgi:hypothetical protein